MAKRRHPNKTELSPDAPLFHRDHARPVTRRDFLAQGFISGTGIALGGSLFSLFANPRSAQAALSGDLTTLAASTDCTLGGLGTNIPFICFDLAGGSNMIGSNVLAGGQNGYMDSPISTAGYSKMGIPGDMVPGTIDPAASAMSGPNNDYIDNRLGLPFHSDSGFLRGILEKISVGTALNMNGAVIPARSDNDTGNNPHNPMYGIAKTGSTGSIVTLIGSRNSESGGNSMSPAGMVDTTIRPTKVDRPSDVTGMVDTGNLTAVLSDPEDVKAVMESVVRLSDKKVDRVNTQITADAVIKDLVKCGYLKAADIADRFAGISIDPALDTNIVDATNSGSAIFDQTEFDGDGEFRKTASVMKMVLDGYAGAGTITMGGYDYHTGNREVGERRDVRAGRCMGACLEYAAIMGMPLMIYVCSDGSVASNGTLDNSTDGRGKGVWTGDNSSTAGSFFLVYNPGGQATLLQPAPDGLSLHKQIGWFRTSDGSVETASSPAANNVNLLVETVILNYLALHSPLQLGGVDFKTRYTGLFGSNLGNDASMDGLTAFDPIV
ncbi:MAG: general secretion pathway protein GspF [Gammaproteobacteria bacterium]|nr:general secretion pathway protein GspF [Gammaproteobacteria bacterium]